MCDLDVAMDRINSDLDSVYRAATRHSLTLNPKSVGVVFGIPEQCDRVRESLHLIIKDTAIPVATEAKNLGLVIDNTFRYRQHISKCLQRSYGNLKLVYPR